ncbi:MAG: zinc-binding dehydrogenase [Chloroflexota bacterium]
MKALRIHGIHDLRLSDEAVPQPKEGEVLLRVTAVGICGSDVHWFSEGGIGGAFLPKGDSLILGHEFCAVIESGPRKGERVTVDPAIPCGKCEFCLEGKQNVCPNMRFAGTLGVDGSLREYMAWPEEGLFTLPDSISDADGTLLETLGIGVHAVRLGHVQPGMSVGIFGCGPVGLVTLQTARAAGASRIFATDKISSRLEMAKELGATDIFLADGNEAKQILKATNNRGVDVSFEAAGMNDAVETAIETAKPGGRTVLIGIPADDRTSFKASTARRKGLTIMIDRRMVNTYPAATTLVTHGQVDIHSLVTHTYPLTQFQKAFEIAERREGVKVILKVS